MKLSYVLTLPPFVGLLGGRSLAPDFPGNTNIGIAVNLAIRGTTVSKKEQSA